METFVGDTPELNLSTNIPLNVYTNLYIKYRKPSGIVGLWAADIDPLDNTCMYYDILETDLDEVGEWAVQAHAEAVGVSLHGKWANFDVYEPIAYPS